MLYLAENWTGTEVEASGSEYVPSDDLISDSDSEKSAMSEIYPELTINQTNPELTRQPANEAQITVQKAIKNENGGRVWNKKHSCVYCSQLYSKIARHLEQKHKDKLKVSKALSLEKRSVSRLKIWEELKKEGDFLHNTDVLKKGVGDIIPIKRPTTEIEATRYLPCEHCRGFFLKNDLWRHVKNCSKKERRYTGRRLHQVASTALLPVSEEASGVFAEKILNTMSADEISLTARNDKVLVKFGKKLFQKCSANPHQFPYVKQKIRELARFLRTARTVCSDFETLEDCIDPRHFEAVLTTVRKTCGFDEFSSNFGTPSLALKLGHSLKKCADIVRATALQSGDEIKGKQAKDFKDLCISEWNSEISSIALENLHHSQFNKPRTIPLAQDIRQINEFMKIEASTLVNSLEKDVSVENWKTLAEITLGQMVLFNRRRGGETERLEVTTYQNGIKHGKSTQEDILASLSPFEQQLVKKMARVEIRGKGGRRVAILFTERHQKQIEILNASRTEVGIPEGNKFVFARIGDYLTPIRSSDVLRNFALSSGAKQPELLTSTRLRKHIGTVSQVLNLKDNELDVLAGFLGHDVRIHREYYRLPDDVLQLAKVSKLLIELENGNIQKHKGKCLDEIQLEDEGNTSIYIYHKLI